MARETLPTCLLRHAERTPDKVFIEVWGEEEGVSLQLTFGEMADCMLSGAQWLRAATGLQRGEYCAMLAHNSVGYLSISLGAMALGAISLNLNWRQPEATTRTLLEDLAPKVLVASKPFRGTATAMHKALGIKMVLIESVCAPTGLPLQPPAAADAEILRAEIRAMAAGSEGAPGDEMTAAVFFTGGTTGTPKAVPHTHRALLWLAEQQLQLFPEPFGEDVPNAGTVCFTPFFHVMGFCANLVFNLHSGVRAFLLSTHEARLSPSLILQATATLRPSCINTVPWIVEGLVELIRTGEPSAADTMSTIKLLTYGGAALPPHCAPVLAKLGVVLACTYGQTELAGPVMFGKPGGDPNALRPLPGVGYELVRGVDDAEGEGELVLLGNVSSTANYLKLPSETREYRSLTGGRSKLTTAERFCTGDRFTTTKIDGEDWLLYLCRADDLLVHTSGEMTNPLPTEQMILAECAGVVEAACCCGSNMARPLLLLELAEGLGLDDEEIVKVLEAGLLAANGKQPGYSAVLKQHVLIAEPGSLPRTVKGTVQRNKAEQIFAADLKSIARGEAPSLRTLGPNGELTDSDAYDSLALTSSKKEGGGSSSSMLDHLVGVRTVGTILIVCAHFATRDANMSFLDRLQEHAHVAASFFVVISGFGMMWGQGNFDPFKGAKAKTAAGEALAVFLNVLGWYRARISRIVLTTWLSMLLGLILDHYILQIDYKSNMFSCFFFLEFWTIGQSNYDDFPAWMRCPNVPAWYIASLVPCWLLFPVTLPFFRSCLKFPKAWPLLPMLLLLSAASYAPVQALIKKDPLPMNMPNFMFYFPPSQFADFFAGAGAAALAKSHQPVFKRWLTAPTKPQTGLAAIAGMWRGILLSCLVDACMVAVAAIFLQPVDAADRAKEAALYHSGTLPMCFFLYFSVVSSGSGLTTLFLRSTPLVSLGQYALYVYLFQMPYVEFFAWAATGGDKAELQMPNSPPWRSLTSDSFVFYLTTLWILSALYAEFVEAPIAAMLPGLWKGITGLFGRPQQKQK